MITLILSMTKPKLAKLSRRRRRRRRDVVTFALATTWCITPHFTAADCNPCEVSDAKFVQIPDTDCVEFIQCNGGDVAQQFTCQAGLIFDSNLGQCNWAYAASCGPDPVCPPPTFEPTVEPTPSPPAEDEDDDQTPQIEQDLGLGESSGGWGGGSSSSSQGAPPTSKVSPNKDAVSSTAVTAGLEPIRLAHHFAIWAHLNANKIAITNKLLRLAHRMNNIQWSSNIDEVRNYAYYDFYNALRKMTEEGYEVPVASDDSARNVFYLGNPQFEDAAVVGLINVAIFLSQAMADSISTGSCNEIDEDNSSSCGEYGDMYQDMHCSLDESFMECSPESACWHGRGSVNTRGVCQYGKLNYYLGARAAQEGRPSIYPTIDFCDNPQIICSIQRGDSEIEWIAGLFRWIDDVQSYDDGQGWNYMQRLHDFVAGGMTDDAFIHSVSAIVMEGCHVEGSCGRGVLDMGARLGAPVRWSYFLMVLEVLGLHVDVS